MGDTKRIDLMEAAHRLGVDYHVVRRWALTRVLQAERINGHWYVDAEDLKRLCGERGVPPALKRSTAERATK